MTLYLTTHEEFITKYILSSIHCSNEKVLINYILKKSTIYKSPLGKDYVMITNIHN